MHDVIIVAGSLRRKPPTCAWRSPSLRAQERSAGGRGRAGCTIWTAVERELQGADGACAAFSSLAEPSAWTGSAGRERRKGTFGAGQGKKRASGRPQDAPCRPGRCRDMGEKVIAAQSTDEAVTGSSSA